MNAESYDPDPDRTASSHAHAPAADEIAEAAEGRRGRLAQPDPMRHGATEAPKENRR